MEKVKILSIIWKNYPTEVKDQDIEDIGSIVKNIMKGKMGKPHLIVHPVNIIFPIQEDGLKLEEFSEIIKAIENDGKNEIADIYFSTSPDLFLNEEPSANIDIKKINK